MFFAEIETSSTSQYLQGINEHPPTGKMSRCSTGQDLSSHSTGHPCPEERTCHLSIDGVDHRLGWKKKKNHTCGAPEHTGV